MKLKAYMLLSNLRDGALPQSDLCACMHLDPNNCVLMLNDLEAVGHVERRRDPADRRRHIVAMTPGGEQALARAERAMESLEEEVLGALAPEDREALRGLLARAMAGDPPANRSTAPSAGGRSALVADLGEVVVCPVEVDAGSV